MSNTHSHIHFIELEFEQSADQIIMRLNESPLRQLRTPFEQPFPEDVLSDNLGAIERQELSREERVDFGQ